MLGGSSGMLGGWSGMLSVPELPFVHCILSLRRHIVELARF